MTPNPWSHTALDTFKNCPRQFHAKYVLKNVKEPPSPALAWGREVHTAFENRMKTGAPVPANMVQHAAYLTLLEARPGEGHTEQKIALNKQARPCGFFAGDVWYRGAIDYMKIDGETALIIDYKTGKPHQKNEQLLTFALHTFITHPQVMTVDGRYYWTQTGQESGKAWVRADVPAMWASLVPDLKQYAEAFRTDIWQPRQSGLCRAWCPVFSCEFNGRSGYD